MFIYSWQAETRWTVSLTNADCGATQWDAQVYSLHTVQIGGALFPEEREAASRLFVHVQEQST